MIAVSVHPRAAQRSREHLWPEDDGLRRAALDLLRSSGYAALRNLRCEVTQAVVMVEGVVPSYFLKQMAQAVLQRLDGMQRLRNLVEVGVTEFSEEAARPR